MRLIEVKEDKAWDAFISSQPKAQFTQSSAWGAFRVARNQDVRRFALVEDDGSWVAAAMFFFVSKPPRWGYWYAPRGPVLRHDVLPDAREVLRQFFDHLRKDQLPKPALFWRCEPAIERAQDEQPLPPAFLPSHAYQPASTTMLDLAKDETVLLGCMREKTRYNVRLAERKGVMVRLARTAEDVDAFIRLNEETSARDRFVSQPAAYIRETYAFLHERDMADIRMAELGGELLAASLEVRYGDTTTYLYGASSNTKRNTMAPYALHWHAIRTAKVAKYRWYDFYGVNPEDRKAPSYKASWNGITRFKLGWGGERMDYVGTWELPKHALLYRAFRFFLR
jgi:lipid II:glycine glycyltransferase (peptidoglycan interpeptide bridge formation enzyme)